MNLQVALAHDMKKGFTLVETMIVITIMMILGGVGYTVSISFLRSQALVNAANLIESQIVLVQVDAYTQDGDLGHGIKIFENSVVRFAGSDYDSRNQALDVVIALTISIEVSGDSEIVFLPGALSPTSPTSTHIQTEKGAFDISVSSYGILEIEKGTIQP